MKDAKHLKIDIFNKGNHVRDFTYVEDVVKIVAQLIKKKPKISAKTSKNHQKSTHIHRTISKKVIKMSAKS